MKSLLGAFSLLTLFPLPRRFQCEASGLAATSAYFPLVGLFLGVLLAGIAQILNPYIAPAPLAVLLLILLTGVTGGLHLDGLADLCDGLGAGGSPERRLAVMKESQIGAFGAIALVLALLLKFTLFQAVLESGSFGLFILMEVLSRWTMVLAAFWGKYPRSSGTGLAFIGQVRLKSVLFSTLWVLVVCLFFLQGPGLLLLIVLAACAALFVSFVSKKLEGITGDALGALNEEAEAFILILVLYVMPFVSLGF